MAAQFRNVTLPEPHDADLAFEVPSGLYRCRVVQYALEARNWEDGCDAEFGIELEPTLASEPPWATIPWSKL